MPTRHASPVDTATRKAARDTDRRPRLQLEFSEEAYERLNELKQLTGSRTNAETIRKALHVLDWVIARTREDYRIQLVKDENVREVELVGLRS
jgi:hypothetical protein